MNWCLAEEELKDWFDESNENKFNNNDDEKKRYLSERFIYKMFFKNESLLMISSNGIIFQLDK